MFDSYSFMLIFVYSCVLSVLFERNNLILGDTVLSCMSQPLTRLGLKSIIFFLFRPIYKGDNSAVFSR